MARVQGDLYDLGAYPGLVISDQPGHTVIGEVYSLNASQAARTWRLLDEYEGCADTDPGPHEYDRRLVRVALDDGQELEAWAYVLRILPETAVLVPGGDYLMGRGKKRTA